MGLSSRTWPGRGPARPAALGLSGWGGGRALGRKGHHCLEVMCEHTCSYSCTHNCHMHIYSSHLNTQLPSTNTHTHPTYNHIHTKCTLYFATCGSWRGPCVSWTVQTLVLRREKQWMRVVTCWKALSARWEVCGYISVCVHTEATPYDVTKECVWIFFIADFSGCKMDMEVSGHLAEPGGHVEVIHTGRCPGSRPRASCYRLKSTDSVSCLQASVGVRGSPSSLQCCKGSVSSSERGCQCALNRPSRHAFFTSKPGRVTDLEHQERTSGGPLSGVLLRTLLPPSGRPRPVCVPVDTQDEPPPLTLSRPLSGPRCTCL